MPDSTLYLQTMIAAFVVSGVLAWWISVTGRIAARTSVPGGKRTRRLAARAAAGTLAAVAAGAAVGCVTLRLRIALPPVSALDRFFVLLLPAILLVEILALTGAAGLVGLLRTGLAVALPSVLLRGSVYVSGGPESWTTPVWLGVVGGGAALLTVSQYLLKPRDREDRQTSVSVVIAFTILAAGITIMLAGYLKGGAAAFPFAAAVAGAAAACCGMSPRPSAAGAIQLGLWTVFSLLFIGCFFGAVPVVRAVTLFLAPVCCRVTALPWLRNRPVWQTGPIQVLTACVPLSGVLTLAIRDFRVRMAPLL